MTYYPIGKAFLHISKDYISILHEKLKDLEIDRYYYVILVLDQSNRPMCQGELGEAINQDKVTMVRVIDYLENKGIVTRIVNPNDRRQYNIVLTEYGHELVPKIQQAYRETDEIVLKGVSENEKSTLNNILMKIIHNVKDIPMMNLSFNIKHNSK